MQPMLYTQACTFFDDVVDDGDDYEDDDDYDNDWEIEEKVVLVADGEEGCVD